MKIYLAGPMTGYPEHNFPAFHAEAARLRALSIEVINPAELSPHVEGAPWSSYLKRDIPQLCTCDGVVTMEGWEASRGATLEVYIAQELDMFVMPSSEIQTRVAIGVGGNTRRHF